MNGQVPKLTVIWDTYKHLCPAHFALFRNKALTQAKWQAIYDVYKAWHDPNVIVAREDFEKAIKELERIGAMGDVSYKLEQPQEETPTDQVF